MKKFIWLIFVFLMFIFPNVTLAEKSTIEVKGITTESKSTNAEIIEKPTIKGLNVGYKIKLNVVGDYVEYKIKLKNNDNNDYELNETKFNNNKYFKYEVKMDEEKVLKSGEEKNIFVKIIYENKIDEDDYKDNIYNFKNSYDLKALFNESEITTEPVKDDKEETKNEEEIKNPETGLKDYALFILGGITISGLVLFFSLSNTKYFKTFMLIFGIMGIIPILTYAKEISVLKIETEVIVDKNENIYEVTINPNGGTYNKSEETTKIELINGKTYKVSLPEREGYIFSRWIIAGNTTSIYNEEESKVEINGSNIELKAIWIKEDEIVAKIKETNVNYESIQAAFNDAKNGETVILLRNSKENTNNKKKIIFEMNGYTQEGMLENEGNITIYGGKIKSDDIGIKNKGALTLGINDEKVNSYNCKVGLDVGCVEITGNNRGIETTSGEFNFYDGYIKGSLGLIGGCKDTPIFGLDDDGTKFYYKAVVDKDKENNLQLVYLSDSSKAVSKTKENGEVYYYNLQDNINASTVTGYEIYAVRNFEAAYELNVLESANITFNLAGYEVSTGNDITNNGILKIKEEKDGSGILKASHAIKNLNELNLENIKIEGTTESEVINNAGNLNMINSIIQGSTGYGIKATKSNCIIKMDETSKVTSTGNHGLYIGENIEQTIDGGNYESASNRYAVYIYKGTFIVNDININAEAAGGIYNSYGILTINNGNIYSKNMYAISNNGGKAIIKKGTFVSDGDRETIDNSYGNMTIDGGTFKSKKSHALINDEIVTINGGKFYSESSSTIFNEDLLEINAGEFISENNIAIYNTTSFSNTRGVIINGGLIKSNGTSENSYALYNNYKAEVNGGRIESTSSYGIYNNWGTLVIGKDDGNIEEETPYIIGLTYGLYVRQGDVEFYDGSLVGKTDGYYGVLYKISDGTSINEKNEQIGNSTFKIKYLKENIDFLEVNEVKYNSFEKAIEAIGESGTIKVIESVNLNYGANITKDKDITLDLNGREIVTTVSITNYGKLKIIDSSTEQTGSLINTKTYALDNRNTGELTIEGGKYKTTENYAVLYNITGKVNVKNGTFESEKGYAIQNNSGTITIEKARATTKTSNVIDNNRTLVINSGYFYSEEKYALSTTSDTTINGGTFISEKSYAIYNTDLLTINEGEIISRSSIALYTTSSVRSRKLIINGGTIKSVADSTKCPKANCYGVYNNYKTEVYGGTIYSESSAGLYNNSWNLTIGKKDDDISTTSPSIRGLNYGVYIYSGTAKFYDGILKGKVSGYFNEFSELADAAVITSGIETINNEKYKTNYLKKQSDFLEVDGKKYNSFDKAIAAIDEIGTIKVIESVQLSFGGTFPKEKNITLDLNGKNISTIISLTNYGKLKIIDSSTEKTGSLINTKTYALDNRNTGELTIDGGKYKTTENYAVLYNLSGKVNVKKGTFESEKGYAIQNNAGTITIENARATTKTSNVIDNNRTLVINGGYFYSEEKYALSTTSDTTINGGTLISEKSYAIYNTDLLTINDGDIISKSSIALYNITSNVTHRGSVINGGTIKSEGTSDNSYAVYNNYKTEVYGGTIESLSSYGIYNNSWYLTIGTNNDNVKKNTPVIKGKTYGLYIKEGTVKFFDGVLKGQVNGYYGNFESIQSGYKISSNNETIDGVVYNTNYLISNNSFIKNEIKNISYNNLQTAIDESDSNDSLIVTVSSDIYDEITIPTGKTITINFNGKILNFSKTIINKGILNLINDKENPEIINMVSTLSSSLIRNYGELYIKNLTLKANRSYTIDNYSKLNIVNSAINGYTAIYNQKDSVLTGNNISLSATSNALYNLGKFEIGDVSIYTTSYGIYNSTSSTNVSKISKLDVVTEKTYSEGGVYNNKGNIEIDNLNINSGLTNNSSLYINSGEITYKTTNKGILNVKDVKFNYSEEVYYASIHNGIVNYGTLFLKNSKFKTVNQQNDKFIGIINRGNATIEDTTFEMINDKFTKYSFYQESGTSLLTNYNVTISGGNTNYGVYVKSGDLTLKNGSINVYDSETAYGMYIVNGNVTIGEEEEKTSSAYGTKDANVSITNPNIKAIGKKTGIGVKKANGYFNFYDGIITGSTSAKPEVTSSVEYKYQVETYKDVDNNEYCILEYMKE